MQSKNYYNILENGIPEILETKETALSENNNEYLMVLENCFVESLIIGTIYQVFSF